MATDERLRREIDDLGRTFGDTVRRFAGVETFEAVEQVRRLARRFCDGDAGAADELDAVLRDMPVDRLRGVTQAFSGFLELANLAEDRQRVRALRDRERTSHPAPRPESVAAAIRELKAGGVEGPELAELLSHVKVELVFTAHPTEAKRKSLRVKLRELRRMLGQLDDPALTPREAERLRLLVRREIVKLWQTDVSRPTRPTVLEEVRRGLSFKPTLWRTVPRIMSEARDAIAESYGAGAPSVPPVLSFGSWMGGDRDGHPYVTPEITWQTLLWLRVAAVERHLENCDTLIESLSLSVQQAPGCATLYEPIATACATWPEVVVRTEISPPFEVLRRWLSVLRWRLEKTLEGCALEVDPAGAYTSAEELAADVDLLRVALVASGNEEVIETEVQTWLDQVDTFGLHTARLDVRQHSEVYRGVIDELWRSVGFLDEGETLDEAARCKLLVASLATAANYDPVTLSDSGHETLRLFRVLRRAARRFGLACLGGHVISMTQKPSDLLTVLWLWNWSSRTDGGSPLDADLHLPVIPLFETIGDLAGAGETLGAALDEPAYRDHVRACGDRQTVMIGYSDSTKDGGYLAACWGLQRVQIDLHEVAAAQRVHLTFFHGRGGSLGRGGGPAARSILSLPPETFDGSLRLTEQGEVLAERYDDPAIAHRHLEQVIWAVLRASHAKPEEPTKGWRDRIEGMAAASFAAYRRLVEHPSFTEFFRAATPISAIEGLPIGSRPAKRKTSNRIEDLRAIPWVFSWTQCRALLPAWYGLGSGLRSFLDESPSAAVELQRMYREWPFFRATIDNAVLALAKANRPVFRRYARLAGGEAGMTEVSRLLEEEFDRTTAALLLITGGAELLDDVPWLKQSIRLRNRYVDPLNLVQLEVMRRVNECVAQGVEPPEELRRVSQLVIKGLAAGMRTTG
ncbi:MAG: phosphoenolpyruvate carboxylase [Lacipirellulaceae bacterium]